MAHQNAITLHRTAEKMGKVTEPGDRHVTSSRFYDKMFLFLVIMTQLKSWAVGIKQSKDAEVMLFDASSDLELTWKLPEIWNVYDDKMLCLPGVCLDLRCKLYLRVEITKRLTIFVRVFSSDTCLLIISTTAILSDMNKILLLVNVFPHISIGRTIV